MTPQTPEHARLEAYRSRAAQNWKLWGPYLSERAWGTVREDYSTHGTAWDHFPHDQARSRAYRWGEDGIGGISDRGQHLCLALALWNGQDAILKERLFGLTGPQGNHGEDVKEYYYYLDSTPTHSYMKMLYKYPQRAFPYDDLLAQNARRGFQEWEYELLDTGIFAENRYFDVFIEYAKASPEDLLMRITAHNRGPEAAPLHLLPSLWFRNTWRWGYPNGPMNDIPSQPWMQAAGPDRIEAHHPLLGGYTLYAQEAPALLFTENETNGVRLYGLENFTPYVKDAFHDLLIAGRAEAVNPEGRGTKAAAHYQAQVPAGGALSIRLRLIRDGSDTPFADFEAVFAQRLAEADAFYAAVQPDHLSEDERAVQRQALAGMLWSKQLYYYDVEQWLKGDPAFPPPPEARKQGRNRDWAHLVNFDVISMPDKWEYPWYATWDLAFHALPLALVDADFAKRQLELMTREWYMHPNGQLPAYEWAFGDVNPPVHAWAALRVYQMDAKQHGTPDRDFLERIYLRMLINFTWWVNRKDMDDNNVFQGGFLGMDNVSVFDRSQMLPGGAHIDQSDGTAWMGFYCLTMMKMALELAKHDKVYEDTAGKFFEHFLRIAWAMYFRGEDEHSLWDEEDQFFYDALHLPDGTTKLLKVRSMVGLVPLFAVEVLPAGLLEAMPTFDRRAHWFIENRPRLAASLTSIDRPGAHQRRLMAILNRERLTAVLRRMLDENEFLSPYGIRSVSRYHLEHPYSIQLDGQVHTVSYQPAESESGLFGGNSNWRGPVWFPINYLIIESLQKFHHYYGDDLKVECPTGSGQYMTLWQVAAELSRRLERLFLRDASGQRPIYGGVQIMQSDPHWRDHLLFHEYFHGDNGAGLGAMHQTGWTGLVAKLIQQSGGANPAPYDPGRD